jgi:diacylglycerol kinase family enzyme
VSHPPGLPQKVSVIINPISGTGGRLDIARARAEQAAALLTARGVEPEVFLTERHGHARELAASALGRGVSLVLAWGGDGTVNEVASVLAFRDATLGVIPSGSGNGLARALAIPLDPSKAFALAFDGMDLVMDAGELDGRLFFNVAGIGLDARVAHEFSAHGLVRRGLARYVAFARCSLRSPTAASTAMAPSSRLMLASTTGGSTWSSSRLVRCCERWCRCRACSWARWPVFLA